MGQIENVSSVIYNQISGDQKTQIVNGQLETVSPSTSEKQDTIIANQTNGTQKTKLADEYGNEVESTMTNQLKVAELLMLVFS